MEKRAGLRELLVELRLELFQALAEEDPNVNFVKQRALEMTLAQHLVTERMEGGNAGKGVDLRQGFAHAALHFPRRLLRKGQCQDVFRLNPHAGVFRTAEQRGAGILPPSIGVPPASRWNLKVGKQHRSFDGSSRSRQEVDDPLRDDARLAAARPGNDQQGAFTMLDGFRLFEVQLER